MSDASLDPCVIREGPKPCKFLALFNSIYNIKSEFQSINSIVLDIFLTVLIMQEIYYINTLYQSVRKDKKTAKSI